MAVHRTKTAMSVWRKAAEVKARLLWMRISLLRALFLRALLFSVALPLTRWLIAYLGVEDEIIPVFHYTNDRDEEGHYER